ncbi:hypothetical protein AUJ66_04470 [Candidatus Desantisbacteria bacterium CG1_02_38_46]|uniref:Uncharacterized protein n=3 Tax=unclassified Candidatus Desantisiibacteriota TaxID=3106372 RepID=A0A2H9PBH7_9BACT|nr:MAG: hypothetical protein AUJ66_04470 [Candidatus Desantisbacteria bacterium CG1_02_38_46]PIU51858.1 MAG: hypothetical protein COS91_02305 [Candidatus Desantisbacteria bacterium CG07_land_8_20_14_0_80_39_15]PIZ16113.1 MAG: hypothetical protein COY51_03515 [Candidatus Desantisbacteria bacterium CG_4_10_14_0_8_um_filter_39_17]
MKSIPFFILLVIVYSLSSLHCSETVTAQPDTITLIRKSKVALKNYFSRPYKVVRGDTMPGEVIGKLFTYEVKRGDILLKIALKFDISYMSIVYANNIKNPALIHIGDKLFIPKRMIIPKKLYKGLLLNLPEYRLYVFDDTTVVKVYPICIGLTTWRTSQGKFKIRNKAINPSWHIPEEMAVRLMKQQEIVPPGDTNPLGDRWIGLSLPNIGIHSTIDTMSIGRTSSHGCIRLYPRDIHELFDMVKVGDTGEIIYEPVKIGMIGSRIFLEIHRDIYKLVPKMKDEVMRRLESLGLINFVDTEKIQEIVNERRGIPIIIGSVAE